jgi:hypothetical protein
LLSAAVRLQDCFVCFLGWLWSCSAHFICVPYRCLPWYYGSCLLWTLTCGGTLPPPQSYPSRLGQQQPTQEQQQQQPTQAQHGAAWAQHISKVSLSSLNRLWSDGYFDEPLQWRLGFREFGTSSGLQVCIRMRQWLALSGSWVQKGFTLQVTLTVHTCTSSVTHTLGSHQVNT